MSTDLNPIRPPVVSVARVVAAIPCSVLAAIARAFKFTNRVVRQDAPESQDHYFADFAKATPIASVVFNMVAGKTHAVHVANMNDGSFNQHAQSGKFCTQEGTRDV